MRNDSSELLTLTQAAEVAGVSVQTFRVYVASGNIAAEHVAGKTPMFRRDAAVRVAALQRKAVEEVRQATLEKLSAELVVVREALAHQADSSETVAALAQAVRSQEAGVDGLGEAIVAQRRDLEAQRKRLDEREGAAAKQQAMLDAQEKRVAAQDKLVERLSAELKETRDKLADLAGLVASAVQSSNVSASALEEQNRIAADQARLIDALRADQEESHARICRLVDKLAEAFGQIRSNGEAMNGLKPTPEGKSAAAHTASAGKAVIDVVAKPVSEDPIVAPAKVGVVREIEFNYLMERMGYRRLDEYAPEEIVDAGGLSVPDDETIKEFLSRHELGCSVAEVEIAPVTRGGWQMIQYQRVARKAGKRAWMGTKR